MKLLFNGNEVTDATTLGVVQMTAGTNFFAMQCKEKIQINVKPASGEIVTYDMVTADKILDVRARHSEKSGIDTKNIILIQGATVCTDDMTLDTVKVSAGGDSVTLLCRERMTVNVKTPKGEVISHDMQTTDNVVGLRQRHAEKRGID